MLVVDVRNIGRCIAHSRDFSRPIPQGTVDVASEASDTAASGSLNLHSMQFLPHDCVSALNVEEGHL